MKQTSEEYIYWLNERHVLESCTNIRAPLSDGNIDFIHGFDDIKKLQFWIHASPDNFMKTAAHTNPERQTLLVLRASSCIKQEDIVETDVQWNI